MFVFLLFHCDVNVCVFVCASERVFVFLLLNKQKCFLFFAVAAAVASADASSASCVLGYFHFRVNIIPYLLTYILLLYYIFVLLLWCSRVGRWLRRLYADLAAASSVGSVDGGGVAALSFHTQDFQSAAFSFRYWIRVVGCRGRRTLHIVRLWRSRISVAEILLLLFFALLLLLF